MTEHEPRSEDRPGAKSPAKPARSFLSKLARYVILGTIVWVLGAAFVLWWQPNPIFQAGVILVALVVALLIPRRHVDRILAAFATLLLIAALFYLPSYLLTREVEFTIRGTDRDSKAQAYLIQTDHGAEGEAEAGESFHNVDAPLQGKVNSSDIQGLAASLQGRRVQARVYGVRIPMFSMYRNVIEIEQIE